jgi:hypothetical protein
MPIFVLLIAGRLGAGVYLGPTPDPSKALIAPTPNRPDPRRGKIDRR